MNPRRRLACATGFSLLVGGVTGCGVDPVLSLGEAIRHDDFFYTVLAAQRVSGIGGRPPDTTLLVVHFEVLNRAGRVSHSWRNDIAYLVDAHGRSFENDLNLQQALERQQPYGWSAEYVTPAGAATTTMLVFALPENVARPVDLMVRGELLMGDMFDGARFRRTRVRLP
jgi:hypothetical protein